MQLAGRKAHCVLQRADAAVINHGTIVLSDGQPCQSRFVGKRRSFSPETRWRRTGPTGPEPSLARGEAGGSRHCCRRLCMHWLLPTECRLPRPLSLTMPMLSIVWPPAQRRDIPIGGCIKKNRLACLYSWNRGRFRGGLPNDDSLGRWFVEAASVFGPLSGCVCVPGCSPFLGRRAGSLD